MEIIRAIEPLHQMSDATGQVISLLPIIVEDGWKDQDICLGQACWRLGALTNLLL
jgi:hypothetical protein